MIALEIYAKAVQERKGMEHLEALRTLRWYMRITPLENLIEEVEHINDKELLRTLIEAGCRKKLLEAVTRRHDEITKRMRGE